MNCRSVLLFLFVFPLVIAGRSSMADDLADSVGNRIEDPDSRFERAQQFKMDGDTQAALQELDSLRIEFPGNVDYALARAQLFVQLHRDTEALQELSLATALAPDYEDVWKLRFRVLGRQPGERSTRGYFAIKLEAAERFPNALWWRSPEDDNTARLTLVVGAGHEALSNNLPSWNSQFSELLIDRSSAESYRFRIARDARFAGADTTLGVGAERRWTSNWSAGIDLNIAGNPNFQPDFGYSGHIGKTLVDGWVVDLRYRQREYPTVTVKSLIGGVEKYIDDFRIAYSLGSSRLSGSSSLINHVVTGNWYYNEYSSIGLAINTGKEAESIGNGQVLETEVRGLSLNGRRNLTDRIGLQWWLGVQDQGDFYRRRFLGMAVSIRI